MGVLLSLAEVSIGLIDGKKLKSGEQTNLRWIFKEFSRLILSLETRFKVWTSNLFSSLRNQYGLNYMGGSAMMHSFSLNVKKGGCYFFLKNCIVRVNRYKVFSIKFFFAVITCLYLSIKNLFRLKTLSHKGVLVPVFVLARPRDKLGRANLSLFLW